MASIAYFYVYKDNASEWRWRYVATNGKTIAVSSESYNNLVDCEHSVGLMKASSSAVTIGDDSYKRLRP
ncbi:DUF1508 domain-containing protein [Corticibacter populi]|uniref:DUF1508 domain-containing protein n=1 Tax=Corticibacter populi TaxID=1550736 RepID=A0A3M6QZ15_9BURK|nr:DUF1508 domain-containing protein [Corticibacter populi]RMX08133.1 DUF1508 domain-containing protein [Corticibacter populi]RZS35386.1 hypothetical protein EV687_0450 [Corticibacter populi]